MGPIRAGVVVVVRLVKVLSKLKTRRPSQTQNSGASERRGGKLHPKPPQNSDPELECQKKKTGLLEKKKDKDPEQED